MYLKQIRQKVEESLSDPREQLSRGARFVHFQVELWQYCARRLRQNNLLAMSAALSFRTIFAMIPTLVLGFLVLKSIGVVEDGKQALRNLLDTSGFSQIVVPESAGWTNATTVDGEDGQTAMISVADQIERLVADTEAQLTFERIGPVGALLLIWTALTLLITLEQSLNRIFEAPRSRAIARRILLFWSAITLGPVVIVSAVYASRIAVEACRGMTVISWLMTALGWAAPILVGMLVVTMAYMLIPNTKVKFAAAFGGAFVAVPFWMLARWGFALYIERFVLRGNLYGVLGVVPLFMLWVNLSWSIFLYGAQLAHTAANLRQFQQKVRAERQSLGPSDWLGVMLAIARSYACGRGPAKLDQIAQQTDLPPETVRQLLDRFVASNLVCITDDLTEPGYLVARPLAQVDLTEIFDIADPHRHAEGRADGSVRASVAAALDRARAALDQDTLEDLVRLEHEASYQKDRTGA